MDDRRTALWADLTLNLVTPTFLGVPPGLDGQLFPVGSLRGVLRYWLRALVGAHVGNGLGELARAESEVFGAASGAGPPSQILLRAAGRIRYTAPTGQLPWMPAGRERDRAPFVRYLLGPGLYDPEGRQLTRPFIAPGTEVALRVRNIGRAEHHVLFLAALWALRTFGGLGARARRGFGTVALHDGHTLANVPLWFGGDASALPRVLADVGQALAALLRQPTGSRPEVDHTSRPRYPYFDPTTPPSWHLEGDDSLVNGGPEAVGLALAALGSQLRSFRVGAAGPPGDDYQAVVEPYLNVGTVPADAGSAEPGYIETAALGLPVTFSDPVPGGTGRRAAIVEPFLLPVATTPPRSPLGSDPRALARPTRIVETPLRRASPLWLRVYPDRSQWRLRSLAFLAEWLPAEAQLRLTDTTNTAKAQPHTRRSRVAVPKQPPERVDDELRRWFP
ncbi:MAG TPA: RAMP superfamily CRISPR-associated protein [Pseudonocardiaceae bacterium]|nr:RAMP superfamily CRISPR-associated protein [Pseudonocardiaceae bacterium]